MRRTPLRARKPLGRHTGLKATAALRRKVPLRPVATQAPHGAPRDTGPDRKTRLAVYERDGWACACCGQSVIGRPHSVGHRKRRSQGGKHTMDNLLTFLGWGNGRMPDDHHQRIDQRTDPADEARGLTVRSHLAPASVPVCYRGEDGREFWALLEADGGLVAVDVPMGGEAA